MLLMYMDDNKIKSKSWYKQNMGLKKKSPNCLKQGYYFNRQKLRLIYDS